MLLHLSEVILSLGFKGVRSSAPGKLMLRVVPKQSPSLRETGRSPQTVSLQGTMSTLNINIWVKGEHFVIEGAVLVEAGAFAEVGEGEDTADTHCVQPVPTGEARLGVPGRCYGPRHRLS
ncbi:hypothetical protein B0H14DRAFT_2566887 [Mycena olivaceomarginata]|nr:hypothetical protein B0H14DRAFT_2566887 [Mycena olivaceomarginata]